MIARNATTTRIVHRVIGDHRLLGPDRRTEQRVKVAKLHPVENAVVIEFARRGVPRDVGQRMGFEVASSVRFGQDFSDKAEGAVAEP